VFDERAVQSMISDSTISRKLPVLGNTAPEVTVIDVWLLSIEPFRVVDALFANCSRSGAVILPSKRMTRSEPGVKVHCGSGEKFRRVMPLRFGA
jgi:hypothetical protein